MRFHRAEISGRRSLTAHLLRLTLSGDGLRDWVSTGVGDEYVRLSFHTAGAEVTRVYTVGAVHDDGALDVDVALHDRGAGSHWAEHAPVGATVKVSDPDFMHQAPAGVLDHGYACDLTGVPALARMLRGLGPDHRARAAVVVTDLADVMDLPCAASLEITWNLAEDLAAVPTRLESVARDIAGADDVWVTGEARACRGVRRYLRTQLGRSDDTFTTCGYWQLDAERSAARYAEVADRIADESARARARHTDRGDYLDALDDIYDRAGL